MLPISNCTASYPAVSGPEPAARAPRDAQPSALRRPVIDEYIPEKAPEGPETSTGNTDRVDREIERLRKEQAELKQRLRSEADPARARALEQRLAQVERELDRKDNDAYRRQHTVFT